jgi:hypothetical protein
MDTMKNEEEEKNAQAASRHAPKPASSKLEYPGAYEIVIVNHLTNDL